MNDLRPVDPVRHTSFVLAVPKELPVTTVPTWSPMPRQRPGQHVLCRLGIGSLVHLVSELFKLEAGIDVQMIPYNGQPPAIADLLAEPGAVHGDRRIAGPAADRCQGN